MEKLANVYKTEHGVSEFLDAEDSKSYKNLGSFLFGCSTSNDKGGWMVSLGTVNVFLMIATMVLSIVFMDNNLMNIEVDVGQNTFIKNLIVYAFYSSYQGFVIKCGAILFFMWAITGVILIMNGFNYIDHDSSRKQVRDWSHFGSIIMYSVVMALGFLITSAVVGLRSDMALIFPFIAMVASTTTIFICQMNLSILPYSTQNWFEVIFAPVLSMMALAIPWIVILITYSNYTTPDVSMAYKALVIGDSIFGFLFFIPITMGIFTSVNWGIIELIFGSFVSAFNLYISFAFFYFALQ